jgi:hypothetical protein
MERKEKENSCVQQNIRYGDSGSHCMVKQGSHNFAMMTVS